LGDSNGTQLSADCAYPDIVSWADIQGNIATYAEVGKGVDAEARNEYLCLSGTGVGSENILQAPTVIIGGSGLIQEDIVETVGNGTGLVWTPRSDSSLYGNTAKVPIFKRVGGQIGLGTDWTPSGSANLLRELSCASQWNDLWGGEIFTDQELVSLVTDNAAALANYDDELGSLEAGLEADITIWDARTNSGYEAVLAAENVDVVLVMRAGIPLYGEADLVESLVPADNCEIVDICGVDKRICAEREFGSTLVDIRAAAPTAYPLFSCGDWTSEPVCTPTRDAYTGIPSASDGDGDGIEDSADNCPEMFNPPTPYYGSSQADSDNDGVGDVCDS
jgi:hypothetical protein